VAKLSLSQALTLAQEHLAAGRLAEAETVGRIVADTVPEDPQAEILLAAVCQARGDRASAAEHLAQACVRQPQNADLWLRLVAAWETLRRWDAVESAAGRLLELRPGDPHVENSLANALQAQGKLDEAEAIYRHALGTAPQTERIWSNLGTLLQRRNRLAEAEQAYRHAIDIDPLQPQPLNNLGTILRTLGRNEEAEKAYRRALAIRPTYAEAQFNLGCLLQSIGKADAAEAAYRGALTIEPGYVKAAYNLATVLDRPGRLADAEQAYRHVLAMTPDHPSARLNLGNLLHNASRFDEADEQYRRAMEIDSHAAAAHSNLLTNAQYRPGVTAAEIFRSHHKWDRRHAASLAFAASPAPHRPDADRPLRLGFVSADLGRHPAGYFLVAMLEALDRREFSVYCYSDRPREDDLSARIRAAAHTWRRTASLSHEALAEQIRADEIDLLFDLSGHMAGNRLLSLARRPAPVQLTWISYPGTTGVSAIDYLMADRHHVPAGAERFCRERVLRMPEGYVCYAPPNYAPPVGPLPAEAAGHITFACFNKPAKINPELVALWAEILAQLPDARLVLKYAGLDDPSMQARYAGMFSAQGVARHRLDLLGESPHEELLGCYNRVDVALDTRPYSGGLTTCEALWMGVPVVTWPGETFAGRHALSHLSTVGVEGTVATSAADYVARAVQLAGDRDRLASIRAGLRPRMAASPLCDAARFAADFQRLMRRAWHKCRDSR
jgi:predicted O-linked N-acetylglucosamine transferase (SPINDLY family)